MANFVRVDMSGIQDYVTQNLPVGIYHGVVVKGAQGSSKAGNAKVVWTIQVEDHDEFEGGLVSHDNSLLDRALFGFRNSLLAMGWTAEELSKKGGLNVNLDDAVGAKIAFIVTDQVSNTTGQTFRAVDRLISRADVATWKERLSQAAKRTQTQTAVNQPSEASVDELFQMDSE